MTSTFKKLTYTIAAILSAALCFLITSESGGARYASAVSEPSAIVTAYERRTVWNDLQGATINGESIDLNTYGFDERKNVQILSFTEFCYTYMSAKHGDYGLYVYVYNPHGYDFSQNQALNQIQFRYAGNSSSNYHKYGLKVLNYSTKQGYEGLFYKFKVILTDSQRTEILSTLNSSARVYEISGIELYDSGTNATEYKIASKYTYTGYSKGYGSATAQEDTLKCTVDGFNEYLSLDVQQTYYRPKGTHKDGFTRDTLHSVYFSVPNDILNEYGEMTAVHATWLNALTSPIFVTGNKDIYNELTMLLAEEVLGGNHVNDYLNSKSKYTLCASIQPKEAMEAIQALYFGYLAFNAYENESMTSYDRVLNKLHYIFYAENGDADNYDLPREKLAGNKAKNIKGWFETYTERFGPSENPVAGKYNSELFESVDNAFTDAYISADDTYKLTDNTVSNNVWDKIFNTQLKGEHSFEMSAIQKVTAKDIGYYPDKEIFCDKFYIAERDYESFCEYITASEKINNTVFLFRYYQTEYVVHETTEGERIVSWSLGGNYGDYKVLDSNAYFAQSWAQLDFDIIDLTFTKNNVDAVIPCIMSPIDIIADQQHPTDPHPDGGLPWWVIAIIVVVAVVFVILILYLAFPMLRGAFKAVGKALLTVLKWLWRIICAPFKGIAKLIKNSRERRQYKKIAEAAAATSANLKPAAKKKKTTKQKKRRKKRNPQKPTAAKEPKKNDKPRKRRKSKKA